VAFENTPEVPFSDLKLHVFGGPRASVATPSHCGSYSSEASFIPWSSEEAAHSTTSFGITSGVGDTSCPAGPLSFAPAFQAGSVSSQAGAFTPFTLEIGRRDGDQALGELTVHLPPGVAALLSSVTPCSEPAAREERCGSESLIGRTTAYAGLGSEPITLGGEAYLTGPYKGAPFGVEVVTPAVAGPFNLGNVTVRSAVFVDPHTAAATIASDSLPTMVRGIPAQLKQINVIVDRQGFTFNPTYCGSLKIEGTVGGAEGAVYPVSSPFQATNCANLPFTPKLTATTTGHASKADGTSLTVKVTSSLGQANIAKTVLVLPSRLPARLTTIQKACLAATFEANPASCPEGSVIGSAIARTPVLKSALVGPAYLVSHGNAAWPDVEFILQGEGIKLILDGQTAIKKGVTTSSFNSVPDAPVESFEAILPQGPHSALTANVPEKDHYSLCGQSLVVPTTLTGQNGKVIEQKTKVAIQGCAAVKAAKAKKLTRAQKLAKALHACRTKHKRSKAKRQNCERRARKAYGPKKRGSKAVHSAHGEAR
jgi:hypothetical protein